MDYSKYYNLANEIIYNLESNFTNSETGLISRYYPTNSRSILDNLDDIAPFVIYFQKSELIKKQFVNLDLEDIFNKELPINGLLYSYKIDEYLGGLYELYKTDHSYYDLLNNSLNKILNYFYKNNRFYGVYDIKNKFVYKNTYPWSAGLIETFVEMSDDFPYLLDIAEISIKYWLNSDFYKKTGMFPFRDNNTKLSQNLSFLHQFKATQQPNSYLSTSFKGKLKYLINNKLLTGNYVQLMKANTTIAFTLILLYKKTSKNIYKREISNWISQVNKTLIHDFEVYGYFSEKNGISDSSLVNTFIYIDVICDYLTFVEYDLTMIKLVNNIIKRRIKQKLVNGTMPHQYKGNVSHIDTSLDFAISIRRFGEIINSDFYITESINIINSILICHKYKFGYATYVNNNNDILNKDEVNCIDPKYNGLLLKGIISIINKDTKIQNSFLHNLLKDR